MIVRIILKIVLLLVIYYVLFTYSVEAQQYWSRISSPVLTDLKDCFFIDKNTGWISGDDGKIIKTTNGGNNWSIQNTGLANNIEEIFFLNVSTGWALAWEINPDSTSFMGTIILKTSNGGNNWIRTMYPDTNYFLSSVFFLDEFTGFTGGVPAKILKTSDGGSSWHPGYLDSNVTFQLPFYKIKFFNPQIGYACSGFRDIAGVMWATTDGGLNWFGEILAPEPFFDIDILFSNKAIASGGDLEYGSSLAITTNTGANWYYDTLGVFGLATGISFRTKGEGWMTGSYSRKLLYSLDSGFTWNSEYTVDSSSMFDIVFTDSLTGYACGAQGAVLKYDRTQSLIQNISSGIVPEKFRLYQNFPNPFNPYSLIKYELFEGGYVTFYIYDNKGSEILKSGSEYHRRGQYEYNFDGSELPSGIYFFTLKFGQDSFTIKMMLVK